MTVFIIGGAYQGKLAYAEKMLRVSANEFLAGDEISSDDFVKAKQVNRLHLFIKKMLVNGETEHEIIRFITDSINGKIIICDDICGGIIPLEISEIAYRETTGRVLCEIVKAADVVVRVQCGIGQVLKGSL